MDLKGIQAEFDAYLGQSGLESAEFHSSNPLVQIDANRLLIDAVAATETSALLDDLQSLGMRVTGTYGRFVSGWLPIDAIDDMNALASLKFAHAVAQPIANVGAVTSQGDAAMRSDDVRNLLGFNGTGVKVGVLSDSFNTSGIGSYADDQASGDLPPGIQVLEDFVHPVATDEGRAMLQLIHDVAPGASLAFATAFTGQANFANNIIALRDAGADIIVDDVFYSLEPMFQDGVIAQAVDTVVSSGVSYFSAAGNDGRQAYESDFRDGGDFAAGAFACPDTGFLGGTAHDFDPGPGVDILQSVTIPPNSFTNFALDWDSPFFSVSGGSGSPNDVDVYFFDSTGANCIGSVNSNNAGGDAVESFFAFSGNAPFTFNLMFVNRSGPHPGFLKYVFFGDAVNEYTTNSGTVFGHANSKGAEAVGAAAFFETPEFGVDPAILEPYSSAGNTPIFFDLAGNRLATPEVRQKPEIVAPDGTNTTFFGDDIFEDSDAFPNFFGTSAAAPHAAAVAALMLQAAPGTTPATIYSRLESTALDMGPAGFDNDSGFGLIQAFPAIVITVPVDIKPGGVPNSINPKSNGKIPVAILSTASFDAPKVVNAASLTFGHSGNENSLSFKGKGQPQCSAEDVSGDGRLDLVCHFNTQATGFKAGDTVGFLKGKTVLGVDIQGRDSVRIVPSVAGTLDGITNGTAADQVHPDSTNSTLAGVGSLFMRTGDATGYVCTGTPITATHIITAAHCLDTNDDGTIDFVPEQVTFNLTEGGNITESVSAAALAVNPEFTGFANPFLNDDVAIVTLQFPLPAGVPLYALYRNPVSAGSVFTMVGYGKLGSPASGSCADASLSVKRVGQNSADSLLPDDEAGLNLEVFEFDFDGPTGTGPLGGGAVGSDREMTLCGGDSGGPSFMDDGGILSLAAINTFTVPGAGLSAAPLFGSGGGGILLYSSLPWIDSVVAVPRLSRVSNIASYRTEPISGGVIVLHMPDVTVRSLLVTSNQPVPPLSVVAEVSDATWLPSRMTKASDPEVTDAAIAADWSRQILQHDAQELQFALDSDRLFGGRNLDDERPLR